MLHPLAIALGALVSGAGAVGEGGQPAIDPRRVVATAQCIATPEGVSEQALVDVGDDRQWISIRGRNRANPVLLVIHGGPGSPMMPESWVYQSPWEDFFTVVNWDQRGVGKNAVGADTEKLARTASIERIVKDGDAVIDHLREQLGHEKVAVLGFSWGSLVGVHLAQRHPDKISVYAGVGQAVSTAFEGEILERTLEVARAAGDDEVVAELVALKQAAVGDGFDLAKIRTLRRIGHRYNGMWFGHDNLAGLNDIAKLSPDYSTADIAALEAGPTWIADSRIAADLMSIDMREVRSLAVPTVVLQGRYDLATWYDAARLWHEQLDAPSKTFVTFERSAHFVMMEEPGRFLQALLTHVLPPAGGSAEFAPLPRTSLKENACPR
jgi:proline iminopeptidase